MEQRASLAKGSVAGLAQFIVALAALVFVPAWSLRPWPLWLFWGVFSAGITLITLYFLKHDPALIERRMRAGPLAEKQRSQKIIQAVISVVMIAGIVFAGIDRRFGWSQVPLYAVLIGDALLALGLLIVFLVFKENSYAGAIVDVYSGQAVISTGPYRLVRHPMYSGALLMMLGIPPALGSLWGLLFCIPMVGGLVWRLVEEERYLTANLPGYAEYCTRTRYRLIPGVY